jgi:membrane fusion protein, multidrug efflux system
MTEQSNEPGSINSPSTTKGDAPTTHDAKAAQTSPASGPAPQEARKSKRKRNLVLGILGIAILAILVVFGIPWVKEMLNTVSTDDA